MAELGRGVGSVRFGPFELSLETQELSKHGNPLKLSGQAIQVLEMLTANPGKVVTREELQQKLWPGAPYGDPQHGLNAAVNRLREMLGDSATSPTYIETIPGRGYRFIGPILEAETVTQEEQEEDWRQLSRRQLWSLGSSLVVCVLVGLGIYWLWSPAPAPRVLRYRQLTTDRSNKNLTPCNYGSVAVTDGPRVFFSEPTSSVVQVSSGGGDVAKVPVPFACFSISDISPDKTELLGISVDGMGPNLPLWVLSIASGLVHRVGSLTGHGGAWSPDGQRIAYATSNPSTASDDLYIAAKDGSETRKIVRIEDGYVNFIRWSPDGRVLRMIILRKFSGSLWEVSADGSNLHPVLLPAGENRPVSWINWTPDGRYFLFTLGRRNTNGWDIWALRETHSVLGRSTAQAIQLTSGAMSFWSPTPGPDGKGIFAIGGQSRGELVRHDRNSRKVEPFLSGISAEMLDYSRDGNWVCYVTFPEGILWRSRSDGTERMQLTSSPLRVQVPQWSPDGTRIAFAGYPAEGPWKIYVVSAEGGKPEVVSESQDDETDPTWSPDGNTLIFGGHMFSARTRVFSLDLRTGRVSSIAGSEGLFSPRLSPDGRFIVAIAAPANLKMFLFDYETRAWTELANHNEAGGLGWPQWASDSKSVYIEDGLIINRVHVADRKVERVTAFEDPGVDDAGWVSVAPDGSVLQLRDLSVQEMYALDVDWR